MVFSLPVATTSVKRVCVLYGEREKREGRRKNKEEEEALGESLATPPSWRWLECASERCVQGRLQPKQQGKAHKRSGELKGEGIHTHIH